MDLCQALGVGEKYEEHDGEYVAERITREHWLRFADQNRLDGARRAGGVPVRGRGRGRP